MIDDDGKLTEHAKKIVEEAVIETLAKLGVDAGSSNGMVEIQKDFQYLRSLREAVETAKKQGIISFTMILIGGVLGAVWLGIKEALK